MVDVTTYAADETFILNAPLSAALLENDWPAADRLYIYDRLAILFQQEQFIGFIDLTYLRTIMEGDKLPN